MRRALFLLLPVVSCALFEGGQPRPFPLWGVHGAARAAGGCATVEPWVVKSGAEGLGIVIEVKGRASCALTMSVLEMRLPDEALQRSVGLPPAQMTSGTAFRAYVPIAFDSRVAWNRGSRTATLVIRGTIDGQPFESGPWTMDHTENR
jgi:hypothetical protein